ncbi:unnamed protein product [Lampetra fluviatilis]
MWMLGLCTRTEPCAQPGPGHCVSLPRTGIVRVPRCPSPSTIADAFGKRRLRRMGQVCAQVGAGRVTQTPSDWIGTQKPSTEMKSQWRAAE